MSYLMQSPLEETDKRIIDKWLKDLEKYGCINKSAALYLILQGPFCKCK